MFHLNPLRWSLLIALALGSSAAAQFRIEKHADGVRVLEGDLVVADYLIKSKSKPIIWPLLGPAGENMTRNYPMVADSKNEKHDHPHHRSLWLTHGEVNGTDFWLEGGDGGIIEHQGFSQLADGKSAVIAARNIWQSKDGTPVLIEDRRFTFGRDASTRWLDCEFLLTAKYGDVHFGDTKEGSFGLRIAESMTVDAKKGGYIINSRGDKDASAWGKEAEWVDYVGPIEDKTMGIAILNHPSSFHHPNRWHVRTYGLFAANPFGIYHFQNLEKPTDGVRLKEGEKMTLRYRVVLHNGDEIDARIVERYRAYSEQAFAPLPELK